MLSRTRCGSYDAWPTPRTPHSMVLPLDCHYLAPDTFQRAAAAARLYTLQLYNERIWHRWLRMLGRNAEAAHIYRQVQKLPYE
jgi:hypothetical protein